MGDVPRRGIAYEFDVFWSHSGEQKPLVTKLNRHLNQLRRQASTSGRAHFNNFLDTQSNSLPPGQDFTVNIDRAIQRCRVAVAFISKSFLERFWTMKELSALVDAGKPILPVFYGVEPGELVSNMDARIADWKKRHPLLTPHTIHTWTTALNKTRPKSGYVVAHNIVDVHSPQLQRLLSDIRLLLAVQLLKEATVEDEKLQLACEDINEELSAENQTHEYMIESAAFLIKWDAIPSLVKLLKTLYEEDNGVMEEAGWSLDNILEKACSAEAKAEAVNAGAVEALADILMKKDGEKPAAFCLSNILGSESSTSARTSKTACTRLKVKDELNKGAIRNKLMDLVLQDDQDCRDACVAILQSMNKP